MLTDNAVKSFQRDFGYEQTGIVGPLLWDEIAGIATDITREELRSDGQYPIL